MDILIPSLGDIDKVEVIELCIEPGAAVVTGDTLIVIESDKASMDVPATCDGVLQAYTVQLGDLVSEGTLIATVTPDAGEADSLASEVITAATTTAAATESTAAESQATQAVSKVDILVPDLGDIEDVEVIEVAVAAGDLISYDSLLVVQESDKASMEIPSSSAGVVKELKVEVGSKVKEGSVVLVLEAEGADPSFAVAFHAVGFQYA